MLVLFEYASLNGGEMSFLSAAPYLRLEGIEITAYVLEEGPLLERLRQASISYTLPAYPPGASLPEKRQRLAELLRSQTPDLIHSNSLSMTRLAAPVARSLDIPHLGHLRDIANPSRQVLEDLAQSRLLIAVSAAVKGWYTGLGIPAEKIAVLHNGVDLEAFRPGERVGPVRMELGLGERPVVIGIGQLGLRKGFEVWLNAARRIVEAVPESVFLIVGEQHSQKQETREHVAELRRLADLDGLVGNVFWLGRRDDVAQILREADLLMHAARQEPLGRVLLEALASGLPIVATGVGGTGEILPPDDHSIAIAGVNDHDDLCAKATALLKSTQKRAEIRLRYPIWAATHFSAAASGTALARHYHAVYSGAAGRSG